MQNEIITNSSEETKKAGANFAENLAAGNIIALTGNLGSGKTCFAKGIIEKLTGTNEIFQGSPTFALIQEYQTAGENEIARVCHFDFYRVKNEMELLHIGWQEYLADETAVCVIEWADLFPSLLPPKTKWIKFSSAGENMRKIEFEPRKITDAKK